MTRGLQDGLSCRGPVLLGAITALVMVLGFGLWAATVPINGAIVAMGEVDTAGQRHLVQHTEGGVIATLNVREGQSVNAGQVLLQLDGQALDQEWALVTAQIADAQARRQRLLAERAGAGFTLPETQPPTVPMVEQHRLFIARRETLARQVQQLNQRSQQAEAQIAGLQAQNDALQAEAALLAQDLVVQETLRDRGLTQASRALALAREAARISGMRAGIDAQLADLEGQRVEGRLQIETLRATRREEAETQLSDLSARLAELTAHQAALAARRARQTLRAPVAGMVHGLAPLATGAVLRPAETAMQILAPAAQPVLALRVRPDDIDHLRLGQAATVRFPAVTLPDLAATVTTISAAPFVDDRTGARFFRVEATLDPDALRQVADRGVPPGGAVQAFLMTGARTPLTYLLAPIVDPLRRAWRDP